MKILYTILIIAFAILLSGSYSKTAIAKSASNIEVVFERTPLFADAPIAPGQEVSRNVTVKNLSNQNKKVQFRLKLDKELTDNTTASLIRISVVHNNVTIASGSLDLLDEKEITLSDIPANNSGSYSVVLELSEKAGNQIQGKSVNFDIEFGFVGETAPSPIPEPTASSTPASGGGGGGSITFPNLVDSSSNTGNNNSGSSNGGSIIPNNSDDNSNGSVGNSGDSNDNRRESSGSNLGQGNQDNNSETSFGGIGSISIPEAIASIAEAISSSSLNSDSLLGLLGLQGFDGYLIALGLLFLIFFIILFWRRRRNQDR